VWPRRKVCDADGKHADRRPCGAEHLGQRLAEPVGGEEQVHSDRRGQVAELHVDEEDDPEMQRIDAEGETERQHERHEDHGRGKDVEHASGGEKEDHARVDRASDPVDDPLRDACIDHVVGEAERHAQDEARRRSAARIPP
jgi:hypothetical protein